MKLAQFTTLALTTALLALPAMAADAAKTESTDAKPAAKVAAPENKPAKKSVSKKATKVKKEKKASTTK